MARRFFDLLPRYLKTKHNDRATSITEDILYDPETFAPTEGYIGDVSGLTQDELARDPKIAEMNAERSAYQLSVSVVSGELDDTVSAGAFYNDIIGQLLANSAKVNDHSRLFESEYHVWTPPLDIDRWVNFQRYAWTGEGDAKLNGEYITKDPAGSRTVLWRVDGPTTLTRVIVGLSSVAIGSFASGSTVGQLKEDGVSSDRKIYSWNGTSWNIVDWVPVSDVPTSSSLPVGSYYYVARSGHLYQRPVFYEYSTDIGRWLTRLPVISVDRPDSPQEGMMWEDCRSSPSRKLYRFVGSSWVQVVHSSAVTTMVSAGTASAGTVKYHALDVASVADGWSANNWWKHYEDLSAVDKASLPVLGTGVRPILQLWSSIEKYGSNNRTAKNQHPKFNVYAYKHASTSIVKIDESNFGTNEIDTNQGCTILRYKAGVGSDDPVLGFPGSFNNSGEFLFETTIVTDVMTGAGETIKGYRYFKDTHTNLIRSVWTKIQNETLSQTTSGGVWTLPRNLTDNADHEVPGDFSRSDVIHHFTSIITENSDGEALGNNSYRWSSAALVGAKVIDPESSLLKAMSLLLDEEIDLPFAIRTMSQEYARFCRRFIRKLNEIWDSGEYTKPDDTLKSGVTNAIIVDAVLTAILIGKTESGAFWHSDMGTYTNGDTDEVRPIAVPPSPARVGAVQAVQPRLFSLLGSDYLTSHDGRVIPSFGDGRDDVWLELEQRFFDTVPDNRKTVPSTGPYGVDQWVMKKFVTNRVYDYEETVSEIAADATDLPDPTQDGYKVFSLEQGSYAVWTVTGWVFFPADEDARFLNSDDNSVYVFNGFTVAKIEPYSRAGGANTYTLDEFDEIARSEFNRWTIARGLDAGANEDYDSGDRFTWNYRAAGIEGNWRGIYRRIYGTHMPHSRPWEIYGFSIEPTWWRTSYVPTSVAADGSPRYSASHAMWTDLKSGGSLMPIDVAQWQIPNASFPTPVDSNGELLDPIAAGITNLDSVPETTRSDKWVYGDMGPVEAEFWESPEGRYAESLIGYLIKPARFVETLWSDYSIAIGEAQLFGGHITVDNDELTRRRISTIPVHGEIVEATGEFYSNTGIVSWISERLIMNGADPQTTFGDLVRNARTSLGWRCGGFITKQRTTFKTQSGIQIPESDFSVVLHRSRPISVHFHGGVIIVRDGTGYRVYGYDNANPEFNTMPGARPVIGGQVFLREEFEATAGQTEFVLQNLRIGSNDISTVNVLVDGYRIDAYRYVTLTPPSIVTIDYSLTAGQIVTVVQNTVQTSPSTRTRTFMVDGKVFYYYPVATGETKTYGYGHKFASNQDVVEFLYDHGRWQSSQGWVYGTAEDPDIAKNDWLAVASRFAAWSSTNRSDGEIYVDVAGGKNLVFEIDHGHILDVESVSDGGYAIIDMAGFPIKPDETVVGRVDGRMTVDCSSREIYGLRARVCEIEHAVFFSNSTRFDDIIYYPLYGLKRDKMLTKTYRSVDWAGRLSAPGYIVSDGDLLPNFEKQVFDITKLYDTVKPVTDNVKLEQSWNLYGWRKRSYMDDIGVTLPMSFAFHKGLLKYKGTNDAFKSFVNGMLSGNSGTKISENWAWKVAEFGANGDRSKCRFVVGEQELRDKIQIVRFASQDSTQDSIIDVLPFTRATGDGDSRWIIPPTTDAVTNMTFPMVSGRPAPDDRVFKMSVVPVDPTLPNSFDPKKFFHWDPKLGLHSPWAQSQVDIISAADPARYNQGAKKDRAIGFEWGRAQVGKIWWDTSNLDYHEYWNESTLRKKATEWGKTSRLDVVSQIVNDTDITVTTGTSHGLSADDSIVMYSVTGKRYVATVVEVVDADSINVIANLGGDPDPVFLDPLQIPTFKEIRTKDVEVYEWVEYTKNPASYPTTLGTVKDAADPSYVEVIVPGGVLYYFWVRNRPIMSLEKSMSVQMIESELRDPTAAGKSWFAPISETSFIFNSAGVEVGDNTAIELVIDSKPTDVHAEWCLVRDGHEIERCPAIVKEKLIDSILGIDSFDGVVPRSLLADEEKYGTGRGQTVYRDRAAARSVFATTLGNILSKTNKHDDPEFLTVFPISDVGSWFDKANYLDYDMSPVEPSMTVKNLAELDDINIKARNDIVTVIDAAADPYDAGERVSKFYKYDEEDGWVLFGGIRFGVKITDEIFNMIGARAKILEILHFLDPVEENNLIDFMIRESLRQSPNCDWCFRTSLYDLTHTIRAYQPDYTTPTEISTLLAGVNEIKPYHAKMRDLSIIVRADVDPANIGMTDPYVLSISEYLDRLASNGTQDFGWDSRGWEIGGWDFQPWHMEDLGAGSWETLNSFTATSTTTYELDGPARIGMSLRVSATDGTGAYVTAPQTQISLNGDGTVKVTFSAIPPAELTYHLQQALGIRYGSDPSLPTSITDEYSWMEVAPTSRLHAAVRSQQHTTSLFDRTIIGDSEAFGDPSSNSANSQERVNVTQTDPLVIDVKTYHTQAYAGWTATPWDMAPWDFISTSDLPTVQFYVVAGTAPTMTSDFGELMPYTQEFLMDASNEALRGAATSDHRYHITKVESSYLGYAPIAVPSPTGPTVVTGTSGDDSPLIGNLSGPNQFVGAGGSDDFLGGSDTDVYFYDSAIDGPFTSISETGGTDTIVFLSSETISDVTFQSSGMDLLILVTATSSTILVANHLGGGDSYVERLIFQNGTFVDLTDVDFLAALSGSPMSWTVSQSPVFFEVDPSDYEFVTLSSVRFKQIPSYIHTSETSSYSSTRKIKSVKYQTLVLTEGVDYTLSADKRTLTITNNARPLTVNFALPSESGNTVRLTIGEVELLSSDARIDQFDYDIDFVLDERKNLLTIVSDDPHSAYGITYMVDVPTADQTRTIVSGGGIEFDSHVETGVDAFPTYTGFLTAATDGTYKSWNGTSYDTVGIADHSRTYFVKRNGTTIRYDGGSGQFFGVSTIDGGAGSPMYAFGTTGRYGITAGTLFYGHCNIPDAGANQTILTVCGPQPSTSGYPNIWVGANLGRIETTAGKITELLNSFSSNTFVQSNDSFKPVYEYDDASWDYTARISFTAASNTRMYSDGKDNMWDNGGDLVVALRVDTTVARTILHKRGTLNDSGWSLTTAIGGAIVFTHDFSGSIAKWTTAQTISSNTAVVIQVFYDSSSASNIPEIRIDGVIATMVVTTAASGTRKTDAAQPLYLGSTADGSIPLQGSLHELMIFDVEQTGDEREEVYSIVADRWLRLMA